MSFIIYHTPKDPEDLMSKVRRKYSKLRRAGLEKRIDKLEKKREAQKEEMRRANANAVAAQIGIDKLFGKKNLTDEEYKDLCKSNSRLSRAKRKYNCAEKAVKEIECQKRKCQRLLDKFF